MIVKTGDMWSAYSDSDLFLITTNSFLKKEESRLTMGVGIAKQAKERFPNLDRDLGQAVQDKCGHLGKYGLLVSDFWPISRLGIFQVKYHWRDNADLGLIAYSTQQLINFCVDNKFPRVDLNYPGIGNGKLQESDVHNIVKDLPDCVHLWKWR